MTPCFQIYTRSNPGEARRGIFDLSGNNSASFRASIGIHGRELAKFGIHTSQSVLSGFCDWVSAKSGE